MSELFRRVQDAVGDAYHLDRELEGGGMSRLFVATEASLNRQVVIKLLPPEHSSEVSVARFKREMELAANLQHPHILPILGAGARDGLLYYVMPYVAGESLRGRLKREGPLPLAEALGLLEEIVDALSYAHGRGIIHRDIKPENILLEGRHAVLADFGIARALARARSGETITATGTSLGTPGYMAPEQVAGDPVDSRADLYSLAVVGYEMLAGEPPFSGASAQTVLAAHLTTPPPPLHELRPDVPLGISNVMARALSKSPDDRFPSAKELSSALADAARGRDPVQQRAGRAYQRRRWLTLALLAVVTVLGGGALLTKMNRARARTHALLDRLAPIIAEGDLDGVARVLEEEGPGLTARSLAPILPQVAGFLSVRTSPSGAEVALTRVSPIASFSNHRSRVLGRAPLDLQPVVAGEYLLSIPSLEGPGFLRVVEVGVGDSLEVGITLPPTAGEDLGFLMVSGGTAAGGEEVGAFLIGRTEVTNAEYARFVDEGGYRNPDLWLDTMSVGDQALDRASALQRLVDQTGLPGPRTWSGGQPPSQELDHPVTGVSWYEALAYCRWAGGGLPTLAQWYRAALADGSAPYPWGGDGASVELRANFGFAGTSPVGGHPLSASPFGVQDMAGNVREWVAEEMPGTTLRLVVGGSWRDPVYMFEQSQAEGFNPGYADETIGFRVLKDLPGTSNEGGP